MCYTKSVEMSYFFIRRLESGEWKIRKIHDLLGKLKKQHTPQSIATAVVKSEHLSWLGEGAETDTVMGYVIILNDLLRTEIQS